MRHPWENKRTRKLLLKKIEKIIDESFTSLEKDVIVFLQDLYNKQSVKQQCCHPDQARQGAWVDNFV